MTEPPEQNPRSALHPSIPAEGYYWVLAGASPNPQPALWNGLTFKLTGLQKPFEPSEVEIIAPCDLIYARPAPQIFLSFLYDPESDSTLIYDFYGYICTAITTENLLQIIKWETEELGKARRMMRTKPKPKPAPDWNLVSERLREMQEIKAYKKRFRERVEQDEVELDDLDIDFGS